MQTVEFANIRIRAALPLHPYLSNHPHLFLRLLADGSVCGDTTGVNGDLATGVWEFSARLYAHRVKQSLNVAVLTGAEGPGIQVVSVTLKVAELLAREKLGYQYMVIFDSRAAKLLKLVMTCFIKLSSILNIDKVSKPVGDKGHTINRSSGNNQSNFNPEKLDFSSRENLEIIYATITRAPGEEDGKARLLSELGWGYHMLYEKEHEKADFEKALSLHEESMQFMGLSQPYLAVHTHRFAMALLERFQKGGDHIDIERAISYCHIALRFTENLNAAKPFQLILLGNALQLRFHRFGGIADLEDSILCQREAIRGIPVGHPDESSRFSNLGVALQSRFDCLGDLADLEDAISNFQQAVQLTQDGDPDKPGRFSNLGVALRSRFDRLDVLADLEDAISNFQQAVQLMPDGHPDKPMLSSNLGVALRSRFDRLGGFADLEDAIPNLRQAVQLTQDGHLGKPSLFNNLGLVFLSRFERIGGLVDLEDAISNLRKAVQLMPDGCHDKPTLFNNLGVALRYRFTRLGVLANLEDAIPNLRQAVQLTHDGHPDKPARFSNLGLALRSRFECLGVLVNLEDAISNLQQAVKLTPDGHPGKLGLFTNLGLVLKSRFEHLGILIDLENAISNLRQAVELTQDGHPDKPSQLNYLGLALLSHFTSLGDLADLENAVSSFRNAVELAPDGHPDGPAWLSTLGVGFLVRFERLGIPSDLESDLSSLSTAANSAIGPAMVRFKAARSWAKAADDHSRSPLAAFSCAINLLPRIAWLGLAVPDQHALLADVGGIVRDAVAAAIRYEEYETAVVWAEQGRSIVWQNLLGLRSPVDELREAYRELADRLRSIAGQLEESGSHETLGDNRKTAPVQDVSRRFSKLAVEWDNLIDEIRKIPEFEGFLRPKGFSQLATTAHEGPVVILNVSNSQCDALVLIPDDTAERHVSVLSIPLERFSYKTSKKLFHGLTELLSSAGVRERNDRKTGRAQSQADGEAKFKTILRILWQDVVKPVIEGLAFPTESKRPPRIWWCATGLLAFLPIHAAGLYDTSEIGEKVSDYVVSSYTPTLNSILKLSDPMVQDDFQLLMVAQASAPGAQLIPKTEDEVRIIQSLTTGARRVSLMGKDATVGRVRKEMMQSNWIHLACHGKQNPNNPMESGFLLHDKMLKLSEIVKMSLPKADFAFLSACQTAMGDEKVAEESVHLAAGMFLSGCRGVIATTWSIRDDDAPKIAQDVYSRMFKDGKPNRKEAAYALHEAVKLLRDSGATCTSWIPFIHIGR